LSAPTENNTSPHDRAISRSNTISFSDLVAKSLTAWNRPPPAAFIPSAMASCSSRGANCGYISQSHARPPRMASRGMSSTLSIISARNTLSSGLTGANVTPQLPINTVVTPCHELEVISGFQATWASR